MKRTKVSSSLYLAYGTYQIPLQVVENCVYEAIKTGYRHVDTAFLYRNHREVGLGIKKAIQEGICTRKDLCITTKLGTHEQRCSMESVERACEELQIDYVDRVLLHYFVPTLSCKAWYDLNLVLHVAASRQQSAMRESPLRFNTLGVSNFNSDQLEQLRISTLSIKDIKIKVQVPCVNQVELTPFRRSKELEQYCEEYDIPIEIHSPLGKGCLLSYASVQELFEWYQARGWSIITRSHHIDHIQSNLLDWRTKLKAGPTSKITSFVHLLSLSPFIIITHPQYKL